MHDCGRILHPGMVEGQVRGGFAQALGAAVYEELAYGDDGAFLSGTFADYLLPTRPRCRTCASCTSRARRPSRRSARRGVGEGNCMSTPVCLANAVADALGLEAIDLPLTPAKLAALARAGRSGGPPPATPPRSPPPRRATAHLRGEGSAAVTAPPETCCGRCSSTPDVLASVIPGSHGVRKLSDTRFQADVTLGVGPVKGRYKAEVILSDLDEPRRGDAHRHGDGRPRQRWRHRPPDPGARRHGGHADRLRLRGGGGGKVAAVGGRLLDGAARVIIGGFFTALARRAGGSAGPSSRLPAFLRRLLARLGVPA